jgi:hypothetical protein
MSMRLLEFLIEIKHNKKILGSFLCKTHTEKVIIKSIILYLIVNLLSINLCQIQNIKSTAIKILKSS